MSTTPNAENTPPASSRPGRRPAVRVLLAALGWPSGLLDVGSWIDHCGLAQVVICPVEPGLAFRLPAEEMELFQEGPASDELRETFALQGHPLSPGASVRRIDAGTWEIVDLAGGRTYRVPAVGEVLDVLVAENMGRPEALEELHSHIEAARLDGNLFPHDGTRGEQLHEALLAVGIRLLLRLLRFRPHVVGFRIEGGQAQRVRRAIRAVRLVCDAEIVLGGPTATSHPIEVLEQLQADYVLAGEAEETFAQFLELARRPNSKDLAAAIPGLAYRYGGRTCFNTLPADGYQRTALDEGTVSVRQARMLKRWIRPTASTELLRRNRLRWQLLEGFDRCRFDSLFFTGGRGCPGACSFCARLHGAEVRTKTAEQLLEEIAAADALVERGQLGVSRWRLFEHVDDARLRDRQVAWAAIYDEDFFLLRRRALEFFRLWERSPLRERYRLSFQTNPCSLLTADGRPDEELFTWFDRLKPMIQVGAESFHPEVLARWHKRHNVEQLETVLCALDRTGQDYTVFQLLTDFESSAEELLDVIRLLALAAFRHRPMRIASSPFTIPLYDADVRRRLEFRGLIGPDRVSSFEDYERPQPEWMDPLTAELADLADAELRFALHLPQRDAAVLAAVEVVVERIGQHFRRTRRPGATVGSSLHGEWGGPVGPSTRSESGGEGGLSARDPAGIQPNTTAPWPDRIEQLRDRAEYTLEQVREASFRAAASQHREIV